MSTPMRYRKISPNEWLYLSSCAHFGPFAIQLLVAGSGLPSLQETRDALAKAAACNVGARLMPNGKWWVDSGMAPAVRRLPKSEVFSLAHPAVHAGFTIDTSPPL